MISEKVQSLFACICLPFLVYLVEGVAASDPENVKWSLNIIIMPLNGSYLCMDNFLFFIGSSFLIIGIWLAVKIRKKDVL